MTSVYRPWALVLLLIAGLARPAAAASITADRPQTASVSIGAEFASGRYGTDTRTSSLYLPFTASWSPNDRFDLSVEIPMLYQSNANVTTDLFRDNQLGTATAKSTARGGGRGSGTGLQQRGAGGPGGAAATESTSSSITGLGDVILRMGLIAYAERNSAPQIRPSLFIKFPTASKSDGLGTGEFDAGAGFDVTKWYGNLHLLAEGLYCYQGKADGYGLKNYFSYTGAVGYQISDHFQPMIVVKGATAPSVYSTDLLELRGRVIWSLTGSTALDLYGSHGIADSSPDYGGGIAVIYSF